MEHFLKEIKNSISNCTPDELQERIVEWRNSFRNRGISIIALETLLNFYLEPHLTGASVDEAFVDPQIVAKKDLTDDDDKIIKLRSKVAKLEQDNARFKNAAKKMHSYFMITLFIATIILCVLVFLLIMKYMSANE